MVKMKNENQERNEMEKGLEVEEMEGKEKAVRLDLNVIDVEEWQMQVYNSI